MTDAAPGTDQSSRKSIWRFHETLVLLLLLLVAALLRLWRLGELPVGIFRDEAEKALNGWFLLQGGVDATGRPWPVFIEVFGVTTSAIYQYATIPFLAIGGLNEWTARMPAALAGVATVLFTWLLCRRVWGWHTAAWAAGLLAISPWHVPLSRWAQQGVFLPLLFVAAAWAVAKFLGAPAKADGQAGAIDPGADQQTDASIRPCGNAGWLMLAAVLVALAVYAYDPARLFGPLLALAAGAVWWRTWARRWPAVLAAAAAFILVASPVLWLIMTQSEAAQARFRFLSVFQPGVPVGEGLFAFGRNYLMHFSPGFLLLHGDEELRHSGGVGMLNFAELLFAVIGAVFALRRRCRWGMFLIMWILLSPMAASLTRIGVPHALRSQVALPAWQALAAVGIMGVAQVAGAARRKLVQQIALLITLVGALPFVLSYFGSYSARSAVNWQHGVRQALEFTSAPHTKQASVYFKFITGAEYIVPFYTKMERAQYLRFMRGRSRYHVVPYAAPGMTPAQAAPWLQDAGPAAMVTPPGLEHVAGWQPIPINVAGNEQMPPSMLMYLNEPLMEKIKEQSTQ